MTTLYVQYCEIRAIGAQHLAYALRNNSVIFIVSLCGTYMDLHLFIQTLTTVDLAWNHIGQEGAEHLGIALQKNRVVFIVR